MDSSKIGEPSVLRLLKRAHIKRFQPESLIALGSAVVATIMYSVAHRKGIALTPDGWAYWQGAISLIEGKGYAYFSGNSIAAWPPLYSLYLAAWSLLFGPYVSTLILANAALVLAQVFGWTRLAGLLSGDGSKTLGAHARLACAGLFIAAVVVTNQQNVLAHSLLYTIVPFLIEMSWRQVRAETWSWKLVLGLAGLAASCVLTHNAAIAIVASAASVVVLLGHSRPLERLASGLIVFGTAAAIWMVTRSLLHQGGSHSFAGGYFTASALAIKSAQNLGGPVSNASLAFPVAAALIGLSIFGAIQQEKPGFRFATIFSAIAIAATMGVFSIVYLPDFGSRFLLYIPILMFSMLMLNWRWFSILLIVVILPLQIYHAVVWSFVLSPPDALPSSARLIHTISDGKAVVRDGEVVVGPIGWEEPRRGVRK